MDWMTQNGLYLLLGIPVFFFVLLTIIWLRSRQTTLAAEQADKEKIDQYLANINAPHEFVPIGRYITGHPALSKSQPNASIAFGTEVLALLTDDYLPVSIPLASIERVEVEDASTVEKRVTATRLLAIGIFAFAAKKTEVHEIFYLTIGWKDGKFIRETIFEFEKLKLTSDPGAVMRPLELASSARDAIIKKVNSLL